MSDRVIRRADLSRIENNLDTLHHNVKVVHNQVSAVQQDVQVTQDNLDQLAAEFYKFVQMDLRAKQVQLSETRLVRVRQELENKYGHYSEVRRRITGILQAVDVSMVRQETINTATEELMLAAPGYWLAPALISLSSWLNDNKALLEKAMLQALRRDDEKASLFYALLCRRGGRFQASRAWLERYLSMQDPKALEREIVIVLDAYVAGVFGADARGQCVQKITSWIEELSQRVGFLEAQRDQWEKALMSKVAPRSGDEFVYLRRYSPTWHSLEYTLEGARLHQEIYDYFATLFAGEIQPVASVEAAVDGLLDKLVGQFDNEELPLRREERFLSLIIEEDGDKKSAQQRFAKEKALEEYVDFTQILTNLAILPELSQASKATQRFAVALSKNWIMAAHGDLTAKNRAQVPLNIEIEVEQWKGVTRDGCNEEELCQSVEDHLTTMRDGVLDSIKWGVKHYVVGAVGVLTGLMGLVNFDIIPLFVAVFALIFVFSEKKKMEKAKAQVRNDFSEKTENTKNIVRAALAEVLDWRSDYAKEDAKSDKVRELLSDITPEQYVLSHHDKTRVVTSKEQVTSQVTKSPLASQFPDWNLMPPNVLIRRNKRSL